MSTALKIEKKEVFQSRWGFHPCDYELYLKLKFIHKWYYQTLHDVAAWERWDRKEPQNRVIREWIRDDEGHKVGHKIVGPAPEPEVFWDLHSAESWVKDYQNARIPKVNAEGVRPLIHSVDEINQMYFRLKEWK